MGLGKEFRSKLGPHHRRLGKLAPQVWALRLRQVVGLGMIGLGLIPMTHWGGSGLCLAGDRGWELGGCGLIARFRELVHGVLELAAASAVASTAYLNELSVDLVSKHLLNGKAGSGLFSEENETIALATASDTGVTHGLSGNNLSKTSEEIAEHGVGEVTREARNVHVTRVEVVDACCRGIGLVMVVSSGLLLGTEDGHCFG